MTDERRQLPPRRDPRVGAYAAVALLLVALGLMTGRAEPMAVGAAVAVVTLVGLTRADPLEIVVRSEAIPERVIVGNAVESVVHLDVSGAASLSAGVVGASDDIGPAEVRVIERSEGRATLGITVPTRRWGRYRLGELVVRAEAPGGLVGWQGPVADLGRVTVLPRADRVDAILSPPATQVSSGAHLARRVVGDGSEFADIREHMPGDRIRDVNWKVSARRAERYVNRRHPERGGDVVIVLDAVPDLGWKQSPIGAEVLQRMGQAAWALARNHLAGQDRVGLLVPYGGRVAWLPPRGGARARYLVLDQLMRSVEPFDARTGRASFHGQTRETGVLRREDIPPSALVIGLSTLADQETLISLAALRQHGRTTSVLAFDSTAEVVRHTSLDGETVRLGHMMFEARASYLRRMATPVITVEAGDDIGAAVDHLAELTHRSVRRSGAA